MRVEVDELPAAVMLRAVVGLPTTGQCCRIADLRAGRDLPKTTIDDLLGVRARS